MSETTIALPESSGDPIQHVDTVQIYSKDVLGVTQLFARASNGTVYQLTPSALTLFPDIVDNGPGTTVDIINDTRLVVEHAIDGGIAFNCRMPSGNVFCSSQSFPGRAFLSAPEIDFNFFGPGLGPLDLAIGAGGTFDDKLVTRSACFGAPPIGGATITGIDRNETGSNPTMQPFAYITIINTGTGPLTLAHEGGTSFPQNRFTLVGAVALVIPPSGGVVIARGAGPVIANRWFVVGKNL